MFERLSWLFFDFEFTATVINFLSKLSNHNKKVEFQKLTKQNKISRLNTHVHDFTDSNTITKWMNKSILSQIQLPFSIDLQTQFSKGLPKSIDKRFHVHFSHNSVMYHVYIKSIYNLNLRLKIFKIVRPKPIPIFKWHSSNISQSTTGHNSYLQRLFAHTHSCAIEFENEIKWCFPDNVKSVAPHLDFSWVFWVKFEFFPTIKTDASWRIILWFATNCTKQRLKIMLQCSIFAPDNQLYFFFWNCSYRILSLVFVYPLLPQLTVFRRE